MSAVGGVLGLVVALSIGVVIAGSVIVIGISAVSQQMQVYPEGVGLQLTPFTN